MKKHPVSSCCYTDICIYWYKLNGFTIVVFLMFPLKFPSWFLPIWRRFFFRQGLQAALHHLRMGCVCSTWNLLVYLTGQTFFPVKKRVLKKTFIWIQPHFVSSSIFFDWRNRLFSLELLWSLILVVPEFMWCFFVSALLQALFVLPFRFPV